MTGSGTALDPYVIWDVTDLQNIELDLTAYYALGQDIAAGATAGWHAGLGFVPITNFTGHLDGKGHKITGLYINRIAQWGVGLFCWITTPGQVLDVGIEGSWIRGESEAGALVGYAISDANPAVHGCWAKDSEISGWDGYAGGLIGTGFTSLESQIIAEFSWTDNCEVYDARSGAAGGIGWVGGFISYWGTGRIRGCSARNVHVHDTLPHDDGALYYGGFVAHIQGGATEILKGKCDQCYSTGRVKAPYGAAGFAAAVGFNAASDVDDCYTRCSVETFDDSWGFSTAAGFVAYAWGGTGLGRGAHIRTSYSTGPVASNDGIPVGFGVQRVGPPDSVIDDCYTDRETNGCAGNPGDATEKSTAEMKSEVTFPAWDFVAIWNINPLCNDGYPCLLLTTPGCPSAPPPVSPPKREHYAFSRAEL